MANETIGELAHHCGESAHVRKDKNGRLYLACPACGQLKYNLPAGQDYILNNAVMYGASGQRNVTNITEKKPVDVDGFESLDSGGVATIELPENIDYEEIKLDKAGNVVDADAWADFKL